MDVFRGARDGKLLVGVSHLPPLPGSAAAPPDAHPADLARAAAERAAHDAAALADAGFDAVIVENYGDAPFARGRVDAAVAAALALAVAAARDAAPALPVGVNALRNDARTAIAVAAASGARFVRVNVLSGAMFTDSGLIEGDAAGVLAYRRALGALDVAVFADVHVKHATPPPGERIEDAARDASRRGRADALVVTGAATGAETPLARLRAVKDAVPEARVLAGSGTTRASVADVLAVADGAIVGTTLKEGGRAGAAVDAARARAFVAAARGARGA